MDTNTQEKQTKKRRLNNTRATLSEVALDRVSTWIKQLQDENRGLSVSRNDLVSWLITSHPELLSKRECKKITKAHFNPDRHAEWAMKEFKLARNRGEDVTLEDIITKHSLPKSAETSPNSISKSRKKRTAPAELVPHGEQSIYNEQSRARQLNGVDKNDQTKI